MTTVYCDGDLNKVYDQKRRIMRGFWWVTLAYLLFCLGFWLHYLTLPYADPMQKVVKFAVYTASVAYAIFLFPYMGIKYHRARKYYRMIYYLSEGLKVTEENYFVCFAEKDLQKDFVDVSACIFKTWNKKKCEWMEREVYLDEEKETPDFKEGDLVRYVTQSNFLLQYEIIERGVFPEEGFSDQEEKE